MPQLLTHHLKRRRQVETEESIKCQLTWKRKKNIFRRNYSLNIWRNHLFVIMKNRNFFMKISSQTQTIAMNSDAKNFPRKSTFRLRLRLQLQCKSISRSRCLTACSKVFCDRRENRGEHNTEHYLGCCVCFYVVRHITCITRYSLWKVFSTLQCNRFVATFRR